MNIDVIYCGDNTTLIKQLEDNCIDLTVTSPPYDGLRTYNGYSFDFETLTRELFRVTKQGGVLVWVVGDQSVNGSETGTSFKQALFFKEIGFNLHDTMIYETNKQPLNNKRYEPKFEYMFVFSKGAPVTFNPLMEKSQYAGKTVRGRTKYLPDGSKQAFSTQEKIKNIKVKGNIWFYSSGANSTTKDNVNHPAMFPEALAKDHILSWSNRNDIVLDPFMGSGTTAKMAKHLGRHYIGFEISQEYCEIARKRVASANVPLFTEI